MFSSRQMFTEVFFVPTSIVAFFTEKFHGDFWGLFVIQRHPMS